MATLKTYIQQTSFDGMDYTKGSVVDILSTYNIICQDFPFKKNPKAKDLPTRDWAGEDGADVYVPKKLPVKDYEIEVAFLHVHSKTTTTEDRDNLMRQNISGFIDFLYGRNEGATGSRLVIYNEYVGMGRKDITVSEVDNELFYLSDDDPDAVARFKIKFHVYDPTTEVTPTYGTYNGQKQCTQLNFE